jgi:NADH-quinone oxidoreductase subunit L
MVSVLAVLAIGAFFVSFIGLPYLWTHKHSVIEHFLSPVFKPAEHLATVFPHGEGHGVEWGLMLASVTVAFIGLFVAWKLYRGRNSDIPEKLKNRFSRLHNVVFQKYYVDEAYHATAVRGFLGFSRLSSWFDGSVLDAIVNGVGHVTRFISWVDGLIDTYIVDGIVNLMGWLIRSAGGRVRRLQSGRLASYLAGMAAGMLLLMALSGLVYTFYN